MKHTNFIFSVAIFALISAPSVAATCSRANLTRCLDSACAINVSANPAARCQYCGTSNAGTPSTANMRNVSVGTTKYNISDKDLKSAPADPGARYAWATAKCAEIVTGCTADDVSDTYDSLIEQSCRAAGVAIEAANLHAAQKSKTVSESACKSTINACVTPKCGTDFANCRTDAELDNFFAGCSVDATGCDEYLTKIRSDLGASRDNYAKNSAAAIETLVKNYQAAREKRLDDARAACKNNSARAKCIADVCDRSMAHKCAAGYESETSMATQLCKFHDTACATVK